MILSYTLPGAKENIIDGIKLHTMREDRLGRWREDMIIHHALHSRHPDYECFLVNKCIGVQGILMVLQMVETGYKRTEEKLYVCIDRTHCKQFGYFDDHETLAINDGFNSVEDMVNWFFPLKNGVRTRTMWSGRIIHWTDLKY